MNKEQEQAQNVSEHICERCHGEGVYEKTIYRGEEGMEIEMDVEVYCEDCDGTGIEYY